MSEQPTISISAAAHRQLKQASVERGIPMSAIVEAACLPALAGAPEHVAVEVSKGIQELVGDHVVRYGGEASRVFELAVCRALDAAERGA